MQLDKSTSIVRRVICISIAANLDGNNPENLLRAALRVTG